MPTTIRDALRAKVERQYYSQHPEARPEEHVKHIRSRHVNRSRNIVRKRSR